MADCPAFSFLSESAAAFKATLDADVSGCLATLGAQMTTLVTDPFFLCPETKSGSHLVQFSASKSKILASAGDLFEEMEKNWTESIAGMKAKFMEIIEIFLANTVLEVRLPVNSVLSRAALPVEPSTSSSERIAVNSTEQHIPPPGPSANVTKADIFSQGPSGFTSMFGAENTFGQNQCEISESDFISTGEALEMFHKDEEILNEEKRFEIGNDTEGTVFSNVSSSDITAPSWFLENDGGTGLRISVGTLIGARTECLGTLSQDSKRERPSFGCPASTPIREVPENVDSFADFQSAESTPVAASRGAFYQKSYFENRGALPVESSTRSSKRVAVNSTEQRIPRPGNPVALGTLQRKMLAELLRDFAVRQKI